MLNITNRESTALKVFGLIWLGIESYAPAFIPALYAFVQLLGLVRYRHFSRLFLFGNVGTYD